MSIDFEQKVQNVYQAVLRPGDNAIDVGAHVGRHTVPIMQAVYPGGRILAIEPIPSCRNNLIKTIGIHFARHVPSIEFFDCALGSSERETEFVIAEDAPGYSGLKTRVYDTPTRTRKIPIRVRRLDDLAAPLAALRFIKVDAEGGEYDIFLGARESLARFRPLVTFEFGANSIGEYGITTRDMANLWFDLDYRLYDITGRPLATREEFVESSELQQVWDYAAVPAEDADLDAAVRRGFAV